MFSQYFTSPENFENFEVWFDKVFLHFWTESYSLSRLLSYKFEVMSVSTLPLQALNTQTGQTHLISLPGFADELFECV